MKENKINRRTFVKGFALAGSAALAGSVTALSPAMGNVALADESDLSNGVSSWRIPPDPIADSDIVEEKTADFVVIGLGHAGTSCTRWIAENSGDVIAIESQAEETFRVFGEDFGHINSNWLTKQGAAAVDPIEFFNNWMLNSQNLANPSLIMKYAQNSGDTFDWWADTLGTDFMENKVSLDFWPRTENTISEIAGQKFWNGTAQIVNEYEDGTQDINMTEAFQLFHKVIVDKGGKIDWSTRGVQLIKDGDRVTGVVAQNSDGSYIKYHANKAVVLAAGDFSGNAEMRNELCTSIVDLVPPGTMWMGAGRDGSGIKMGVWAGGHIEPRTVATMGGDTSHPGLSGGMTGVWLNDQGQRYSNEFFGDPIWTGRTTVQQNLDTIYSLYDNKLMDQLEYNIPAHARFDWSDAVQVKSLQASLDEAVASGPDGVEGRGSVLYAANDLEALADYAGMSGSVKQNFLDSITRYNGFCDKGIDEDFGKDKRVLWKIDTPPFYLNVASVGMLAFMLVSVGGLHTDGNQQVVDEQNHAIPGLFASGNCCGKRFGSAYFSPIAGVSVGMANTLGRELGKHLLTL